MKDLSSFIIGVLFGLAAQTLTFFQLQGSTKFEWFRNHYWLMVLLGIPVSILFIQSVKYLVIAFDGQLWPSRLIGFSIGAIVFTVLSWIIFNEPIGPKTIVCLILALTILFIQLAIK